MTFLLPVRDATEGCFIELFPLGGVHPASGENGKGTEFALYGRGSPGARQMMVLRSHDHIGCAGVLTSGTRW